MQCRCNFVISLFGSSGYSYIDNYKSTLPHENNMFSFCIHFAPQNACFLYSFRKFRCIPELARAVTHRVPTATCRPVPGCGPVGDCTARQARAHVPRTLATLRVHAPPPLPSDGALPMHRGTGTGTSCSSRAASGNACTGDPGLRCNSRPFSLPSFPFLPAPSPCSRNQLKPNGLSAFSSFFCVGQLYTVPDGQSGPSGGDSSSMQGCVVGVARWAIRANKGHSRP